MILMILRSYSSLLWLLETIKSKVIPMISNQSMPFVSVINDVTSTKSIDFDYTNNTGKTLMVVVSGAFQTVAGGDVARFDGKVNSAEVARAGIYTVGISYIPLVMFVPIGSTYRISKYTAGTGTAVVRRWIEAF